MNASQLKQLHYYIEYFKMKQTLSGWNNNEVNQNAASGESLAEVMLIKSLLRHFYHHVCTHLSLP